MKSKHTLTNLEIQKKYRNTNILLSRHDFLGAFAYWYAYMGKLESRPNLPLGVSIFSTYLNESVFKKKAIDEFTLAKLMELLAPEILLKLPSIATMFDKEEINPAAFSRNMVYMLMREQITTGDVWITDLEESINPCCDHCNCEEDA